MNEGLDFCQSGVGVRDFVVLDFPLILEVFGEILRERGIAAFLCRQVNFLTFSLVDVEKRLILSELDLILSVKVLVHSNLCRFFRLPVFHRKFVGCGCVLIRHAIDLVRLRIVAGNHRDPGHCRVG